MRLDRDQLLVAGLGALHRLEQPRLRGPIDVGVDQPDLLAHPRQGDGEVGGQRRLADAALAAADRDQGPAALGRGQRDARFLDAGDGERGLAQALLERRLLGIVEAGRVDDQAGDPAGQPARADAGRFGMGIERIEVGHGRALRRSLTACHFFSCCRLPIVGP